MKKCFVGLSVLVLLVAFGPNAGATLIPIGSAMYSGSSYNLIYDDVSSLVWLDYTRSNVGSQGTWANQNTWATGLTLASVTLSGYTANEDLLTGWSLPTRAQFQTLGPQLPSMNPLTPFQNLGSMNNYWSADAANSSSHYYYNFGFDSVSTSGNSFYQWAMVVNPAVVTAAAVPEPGTLLLLGSGLVGLAGLSRKKFFK